VKVSIQVLGSLGDVMPYISTALVLKEQGVDVSILAPRDFSALIASHGIAVAETADFSLDAWMEEAATRGTLGGPISFFRDWSEMIQPHINDVMARCLSAADKADVVIGNLICAPARVAAEAEGIPFILTGQQPVLSPTRQEPCAMMWRPWHGERLNRAGYLMINLANRVIGVTLSKHRKSLGLSNQPRFSDMRMHLGRPLPKISTIPWPIMRERPQDWGPHDFLTAYPSLRPSRPDALSPGLRRFLAAGSAPVYIGLGSLGAAHGNHVLGEAIESVEQLGCRGLVAKSMVNDAARLSDRFYVVDHEPHDQVFRHCSAVIHHGGAGTSDTALRAGVPQILRPHFLDQFWFSDRLKQLGVAPGPLPVRGLASRQVADAIEFAVSPACRKQAEMVQIDALARSGANDLAALILSQLDRGVARR
tara:strand:- start:30516 stop:31778 length:1263 start_codon:yes stop_codon:yes gene_type:complete